MNYHNPHLHHPPLHHSLDYSDATSPFSSSLLSLLLSYLLSFYLCFWLHSSFELIPLKLILLNSFNLLTFISFTNLQFQSFHLQKSPTLHQLNHHLHFLYFLNHLYHLLTHFLLLLILILTITHRDLFPLIHTTVSSLNRSSNNH